LPYRALINLSVIIVEHIDGVRSYRMGG